MANINIRHDTGTNDIEFDDDLEFVPNTNMNVVREERAFKIPPQTPSKKNNTPQREIPFEDIELLTNRKNSSSRNNSINGDKKENMSSNVSVHSDVISDNYNFGISLEDNDKDKDEHDSFRKENDYDKNDTLDGEIEEKPKTYADILEEKQDYLFKLNRLNNSGFKSQRKYTLASNLEDIKYEYSRLKRERDVQKSVKFSRKALIACISGMEFLNGKFDPFDVKLDGWSENIMENIDDYDEVFEDLHDKYKGRGQMAPELRLLMMVGGSGFMFHLTNSLFKHSMPNVTDILRQNPDLMSNIQNAALSSMNQNNDPVMNMVKNGIKEKQKRRTLSRTPAYDRSENVREMRGPTGVDDILNQLHSNNGDDNVGSDSGHEIDIPTTFAKKKRGRRRKEDRRELDMGF